MRLPLKKLKRYPTMKRHLSGKAVRIWSAEHHAWWREKCCGYTTEIAAAGIYTFEFAFDRTCGCGPEKQIWYEEVEPVISVEQEKQ